MQQVVSIIVPALNESENIPHLLDELTQALAEVGDYEILIIDDGSADHTEAVLAEYSSRIPQLKYISFTRNFGHQAALRAGLEYAVGDCVISLDADLQHPPSLVPKLIEEWKNGFDVVIAVRDDKANIGFLKRLTSKAFYRAINYLGDLDLAPGSADFRLLDRRVVDTIKRYKESNIFFRGLVPQLGFRSKSLGYVPSERKYGKSNYSWRKMFQLALHGFLSTTIKPLRMATVISVVMACLTLAYAIYALIIRFYFGIALSGWTSIIILVSVIGAIQTFILGVIGEYISQILKEARGRPIYIVRSSNISDVNSDCNLVTGQRDRR